MIPYVGVLGTWAYKRRTGGDWWNGGPFERFMRAEGFAPAKPRPFLWTTDLDGVAFVANGNDWEVGAENLVQYLEELPLDARNVIAHSHGGQVALLAAREIKMRSLIMVGTPVREHIERKVAPVAAKNIGINLHVTDAKFDFMGSAGAILDGRWSFRRTFAPESGIHSVQLPGIGHSGLLCDPKRFHFWRERGLLAMLARATEAAV